MTDYKNIFGKPVKFLATDPDNAEAEGQIWYNSSDNVFKDVVVGEAWSSASNTVSLSSYGRGGAGTQTAALVFAGSDPGPVNTTEEYNGSGWVLGGNFNTARLYGAGAGTQTTGLAFAGNTPGGLTTNTEEYDGTSWSEQNNMGTARYQLAGAGLQTAALAFGGVNPQPPVTYYNITEEYDGSSWTTGGTLATSRYGIAGCGTQTAGLGFGGYTPGSMQSATEEYDGSAWTAGGSLATGKYQLAGAGLQTAGLAFGGSPPPATLATTEKYDGSSWTITSNMGTARATMAGVGIQTAALAAGGIPIGGGLTEEFTKSINVITGAAWASGGNLNTGRASLGGAGSQTAALAFGGTVFTPATPGNPYKNESEEYNGSSWTEGNNLNQARSNIVGAGTQTAAIGAGGLPGGGVSNTANSEEYDGTSWAEGNNLVNASYSRAGAGTQTATILMGGGSYTNPPPSSSRISNTEYYDGTSWSEQNDMNTARYTAAGCGSQTSSLVSGGISSTSTVTNVEEWNGTSWSEVNDLIVANYGHTLTGIQTAALQAAGDNGSVTAAAFNYNGTSWTTAPSVATARQSLAGGSEGSTQTSSIVFGGAITPAPTGYQQTEEFTGETSALNIRTITTS